MTLSTDGRLGNQMGGYAVLYALAKLNRRRAYILHRMHQTLASLFRITLPVMPETLKKKPWKTLNKGHWMSESYVHLRGEYIRLEGYFSSWTFFHHIREEIVQQLSFHEHVKQEAWRTLSELRGQRQDPTYVGVHVRRGDYIRKMRVVYKGVVADRAYLKSAIGYFRKRYREPIFVVVSDDMQWCRRNIDTSPGDVYFAGQGTSTSAGRDLALLAHCNHTIMTVGTFGFWAAYLAGGEVVYLSNYTLPNSPRLRGPGLKAFYLPQWIGIQANMTPLLANMEITEVEESLRVTVPYR